MTTTVIKIGNSNGIVIPAKILKSLQISARDSVEINECKDGLFIKKAGACEKKTPFTVLDDWNNENGFAEEFSLESAMAYVSSIRGGRKNKEAVEW